MQVFIKWLLFYQNYKLFWNYCFVSKVSTSAHYIQIIVLQELSNIICKDQIINMWGFTSHTSSVATTQLRHCSTQAATDCSKCMSSMAVFQWYLIHKNRWQARFGSGTVILTYCNEFLYLMSGVTDTYWVQTMVTPSKGNTNTGPFPYIPGSTFYPFTLFSYRDSQIFLCSWRMLTHYNMSLALIKNSLHLFLFIAFFFFFLFHSKFCAIYYMFILSPVSIGHLYYVSDIKFYQAKDM